MPTAIMDPDGVRIGHQNPLPSSRAKNTLVYIFNQAAPASGGIVAQCGNIAGTTPAALSSFSRTPTTLRVIASISAEGIYTYTRTRGATPKTIKPFGVTPHGADSEATFEIEVESGDEIDILHSAGAGTVNHLIVREV